MIATALFERTSEAVRDLPSPQRDSVEEGIGALLGVLSAHGNALAKTEPERIEQVFRISYEVVSRLIESVPSSHAATCSGGAHEVVRSEKEQLAELIDWIRSVWPTSTDAERERLLSALDDPEDRAVDELSVDELRTRNLRRVQQMYAQVIDESYSVADLKTVKLSRQRLEQLRKERRLFAIAVPHHRGLFYPSWQFDEESRPWGWLREVIAEADRQGLDALSLHRVMCNPEAGDGTAPIELAKHGHMDVVRRVLQGSGELGG